MNKFIYSFLIIVFIANTVSVNAIPVSIQPDKKPVELKAEMNSANIEIVIKDRFIKEKYTSAEKKFLQGNIKAAHDDFEDIIKKANHDDYVFLVYAIKMAEFGFFDLTEKLFNVLDDNLYTQNYKKDIKQFYYPSAMVNDKDIIYLSDAYAGINYNDLALETTSELLNSNVISDSDYKNYLISLGFYKSNNLPQALKHIDTAIKENNTNINYKILKVKILTDLNKISLARKILKEISKNDFVTFDFQQKIKSLNEYVSYKIAKDNVLKEYHLAYYYYLQGKNALALKVLQTNIIQSKQHTPKIYGLMARICYENGEFIKAQDFAERAYKNDKNVYDALITLAELNYNEREYNTALEYFKKAEKRQKEILPKIGIAKTYFAMNKLKKSEKIYEKLLKKHPLNEDLVIAALKMFPQRAYDYLVRIASVDMSNNDIWINLAKWAIKEQNYQMAETYLNNSYYIDENNFKYYYYLSLILKANGDTDKSNMSLMHCIQLNSDYAASVSVE